ncbi:metallophosphatase family protein [Anaerovorax odorimutans]|uniref:Phosphoesterase n=1 Tax=Anaerovorax odorimutans TaxID=109327 RepID=A0ABT1RPV8_9FIRM|nr:metallophosphoesterase family protein [Anaerovorax odorimutans]MCQ4636911.1 metallophosphatase family protein [Anaerovorax odorimutans]
MAKRIGILADTHGLLRPEVLEILRGCDCVIHAGDIDREDVLRQLQAVAPLYIVRGNNDRGQWAKDLDEQIRVEIGGIAFFIVHDKKFIPKDLTDIDVVVFGHSHKYFCETKDGTLWLNPGSCGRRRFSLPVTMAALEIEDGGFEVIRYDISED